MAKFEIFQDKRGEYRWRCKADNGLIIATSGEGYKAKADCKHGVDLVKKGAADAPIEEVSGTPVKKPVAIKPAKPAAKV